MMESCHRRYRVNILKELCIKCRWMLLLYLLFPWIPAGLAQIGWLETPQNVTINQGEAIELPCRIQIETLPQSSGILWAFKDLPTDSKINIVLGTRTESVYLTTSRPHLSTNPDNIASGRYNLRITEASLEDDGIYSCEIIDEVRSGTVVVQVPPNTPNAIATNSSSPLLVFQENVGLLLTCSSSGGNPTPNFMWLKNDEILTEASVETTPALIKGGESVSKLSLRLDWTDNNAQYTCRVWNIANSDSPVEASLTLSVEYVPQISFSDYTVTQNSSVRWTCDVSANPPATSIRWEKAGQPSFSASGRILEINNVQKSGSGEYTCIGSNDLGETRQKAILDVQYAPIITLLGSITVNESSPLNITCYYDANPAPFSVQWSKVNRLVSRQLFDPSIVWNQISRTDSGVYSCRVQNRLATAQILESVAEVNVAVRYPPGPSLITGSPEKQVDLNGTLTLTCQANDPGYPHALFTWYKVHGSGRDQVYMGETYTKTNAQIADAGIYECELSNMMGVGTSASIEVVVNVPPSIVDSSPADISIKTNVKNFRLNCTSIARPQPVIRWFFNGRLIDRMDTFQMNSSVEQQDGGRFLVTSWLHFRGFARAHMEDGYPSLIRKEDFGNYTCMAESAHHPVARHTVFLKVLYAPDLEKIARFAKIATDIGSSPRLECEGAAYPEMMLHWFFNGRELSNSDKYLIQLELGNGFNMIKKVLTIQNFAAADYAVYECIARNELGQATQNVTMLRKSAPDAPTNLQNVSIATTSVTLMWFVGFNGGYHQEFFINVNNEADMIEQKRVMGVLMSGLTVTFNVTDLLPGTTYTFQVYATNEKGTSPLSAPLILTTAGNPTDGPSQDDEAGSGLTMTEVIIVACVCSLIVVALLIVLIVVIIRRKREQPRIITQAKDYESETNRGRPQPINGASRTPNKIQATTTLGYDNPGALEPKHNNGNVSNGRPGYRPPVNNVRLNGSSPHDILYDSHEMPNINYSDENERNRHIHDHPDDPTSPQKDHIDLNLNGMESGYSTPEPSKPKKVIYEVVV